MQGSLDRTVRIWDVDNDSSRPSALQAHDNAVTDVAWSSDCQAVVSGSLDKSCTLWNVRLAAIDGRSAPCCRHPQFPSAPSPPLLGP